MTRKRCKKTMSTYHCQCGAKHEDDAEHEAHYSRCTAGGRPVGRPPNGRVVRALEEVSELIEGGGSSY